MHRRHTVMRRLLGRLEVLFECGVRLREGRLGLLAGSGVNVIPVKCTAYLAASRTTRR